jgi:hypothetical protein
VAFLAIGLGVWFTNKPIKGSCGGASVVLNGKKLACLGCGSGDDATDCETHTK